MSTSPNNSDTEWLLELEESAQGTDLYSAPGQEVQMQDAREDAAGPAVEQSDMDLVAMARVKRRSLGETMQALEVSISRAISSDGWAADVDASVRDLRQAVHDHIGVTEGPNGLLAEIVELAPRLSGESELIKAEHQSLETSLRSLQEALGSSPDSIRRKATVVLGRLTLHRQRGADIVYEAYNVDIATAD
jgi:hypothetical protein